MKRFELAIRAFYVILFKKNHIYADNIGHSAFDNAAGIIEKMNLITTHANLAIEQENILHEAKEILNVPLKNN